MYKNRHLRTKYIHFYIQKLSDSKHGSACRKQSSDELGGGDLPAAWEQNTPRFKSKLLSEGSDLALERAIDIARSHEINQKQLSSMNSKEDPNINIIRKQKTLKQKSEISHQAARPKQEFKSVKPKSCPRCGYNHTTQQKCPAPVAPSCGTVKPGQKRCHLFAVGGYP